MHSVQRLPALVDSSAERSREGDFAGRFGVGMSRDELRLVCVCVHVRVDAFTHTHEDRDFVIMATTLLFPSSVATRDWRMLDSYPRHYVAAALAAQESIDIDGSLDEPAWLLAPWTDGIVDLTRHADISLNAVARDLQMRAKMRWDSDYLYIGAELREQYVDGAFTGHNTNVPYSENDFEVFIDVSGSTEYYVELEMSTLNATYDVKWGVPDSAGLLCSKAGDGLQPIVPLCRNSSFHSSPVGSGWTLATSAIPSHAYISSGAAGTTAVSSAQREGNSGMLTATSWDPAEWRRYMHPFSVWRVELRLPLRSTPGYATEAPGPDSHGGLLDADAWRQSEFDACDPSRGDAAPGRPRYWWVDLARSEHPRSYTLPDGTTQACPPNCTQRLETAPNVSGLNGMDYKEWVWGEVASDAPAASGYMHRPSTWPLVQFAPRPGVAPCRNIEFPARHVAYSIHVAQRQYALANGGRFSQSVTALIDGAFCGTHGNGIGVETCDLLALRFAAAHPDVFALALHVHENATALSRYCTARPCYNATVMLRVPDSGGYALSVGINENRYTWVRHSPVQGAVAPCL